MKNLINSTAILKQHLPEVEVNVSSETFIPIGERMENQYLKKILGISLLNALRQDSLSEDKEKLLTKCRSVIAPLIYHNSTPKLATRFGDGGINTTNTAEIEAAQKWRVYDLRTSLLQDGYTAIQELYEFLEENTSADYYNDWIATDEYKLHKSLFVNNVSIMQDAVNINSNYWLFKCIIAHIKMTQKRYVQSLLGVDFYEDLLNKFIGTTLSNEEKSLVKILQDAISYIAYGHALQDHAFLQEYTIVTASRIEQINNMQNIEVIAKANKEQSLDYINKGQASLIDALEYINLKASTVIFPIFFASNKYVPNTITDSIGNRTMNDTAKGTFFLT